MLGMQAEVAWSIRWSPPIGTEGYAFVWRCNCAWSRAQTGITGILGSNERLHPWMDEGLSMFLKHDIIILIILRTQGLAGRKISIAGSLGKSLGLATPESGSSRTMAYIYGARKNADLSRSIFRKIWSPLHLSWGCLQKVAMGFEHLPPILATVLLMSRWTHTMIPRKFKRIRNWGHEKIIWKSTGKIFSGLFDDFLETTKNWLCARGIEEKKPENIILQNKKQRKCWGSIDRERSEQRKNYFLLKDLRFFGFKI